MGTWESTDTGKRMCLNLRKPDPHFPSTGKRTSPLSHVRATATPKQKQVYKAPYWAFIGSAMNAPGLM